MESLTVYDIAKKDVSVIDCCATIEDAIYQIDESGLRTVVVESKEKQTFSILTAGDLFNAKMNNLDSDRPLYEIKLPVAELIHKDTSLISMIDKISSLYDYVLIVDENKKLEGIISATDMLSCIDPELLMKKQSIGNFIEKRLLKSAYKDESTVQVISQIKTKPDGAIVIIDNEIPVGIFTTKDIIRLLKANSDLSKPIKEYMTTPVEYINHNISIVDALQYIKKKHYKRIVVVDDNNHLLGKITQHDLLKLFHNKWIEILKLQGEELSKTNKLLDQKFKKLSKHTVEDYLTKVFTRFKFEEYINLEIEKINRYKNTMFSLLLLDIDDFKKVNDTYGHLVGDEVLKKFASIIKEKVRASDLVARWGGEEFVVLLPCTSLEESIIVAEKLRCSLKNHNFEDIGNITCSIGATVFKAGDTKTSIFSRADEALYLSKKTGKNRVSIK